MTDKVQVVVTGYTQDGVEVRLPVYVSAALTPYQQARNAADEVYKAGLTPRQPSAESYPLFERHDIGYVIRHEKDSQFNENGSHIIDMYTRRGFKSAVVRHYINTDAQAKYFEEVSGLKLADIPLSPSDKYELNRDNPAPFVREVDLILVRKDIGADQAAKNGKGNRKGLQYFVHRLLARDSKSPVDDSAPDADTESAPTSTPAAITDAANALSQPPSADPTFDEMFPKSDAQIKSPFPKTRRDLAYEETNMRHNYGHRQHFNKLMDLLTSQDKVHKEMTVEEIVAAIDAHYAAKAQEKASA